VIASVVTNFDAEGGIDLAGFTENIRYVARAGVGGVCVAGGTGEAPTLRLEEYELLLRCARHELAPQQLLVAGVLFPDQERAREATTIAEAAGADQIMVMAPTFCNPTQGIASRYLAHLIHGTNIPVVLFNTRARAGMVLDADTIIELARTQPNLVSLKDGVGDLSELSRIGQTCQQLGLLAGFDELILPTLAIGGCGTLNSLAAVAPRTFVALVESFTSGHLEAALQLHRKATEWAAVSYAEPSPLGIKYLLDKIGCVGGGVRLPLTAPDSECFRSLDAVAAEIVAEEQRLAESAAVGGPL
jgi:4-hydroxy-tetrahydrodipicolinate synthase